MLTHTLGGSGLSGVSVLHLEGALASQPVCHVSYHSCQPPLGFGEVFGGTCALPRKV